jgi:AcrR family transcriptional regulator
VSETLEGRPYGGQMPDARRAERKRRLLEAGLDRFGTVGYAATTISQLCKSAGVAPAKFYEEFASREAVLIELCAQIWGAANDAIASAVDAAPAGDVEAQARAGLDAFCHSLLDDPRRARVLCIELVGVSDDVERWRRASIDSYTQLVTSYLEAIAEVQGTELPDDAAFVHTVVRALAGAVTEALAGWLLDDERPSMDRLVDALVGMFSAVANWLAHPATTAESTRHLGR